MRLVRRRESPTDEANRPRMGVLTNRRRIELFFPPAVVQLQGFTDLRSWDGGGGASRVRERARKQASTHARRVRGGVSDGLECASMEPVRSRRPQAEKARNVVAGTWSKGAGSLQEQVLNT